MCSSLQRAKASGLRQALAPCAFVMLTYFVTVASWSAAPRQARLCWPARRHGARSVAVVVATTARLCRCLVLSSVFLFSFSSPHPPPPSRSGNPEHRRLPLPCTAHDKRPADARRALLPCASATAGAPNSPVPGVVAACHEQMRVSGSRRASKRARAVTGGTSWGIKVTVVADSRAVHQALRKTEAVAACSARQPSPPGAGAPWPAFPGASRPSAESAPHAVSHTLPARHEKRVRSRPLA